MPNKDKSNCAFPHLLVMRLSAMGDVALLAPVLQALSIQHPTLKVTLVTQEKFFPIFKSIHRLQLIQASPKTDHKGVLGLWRLFKTLRALRCSVFVDVHWVLRSRVLGLMFRLSGTPVVHIDKGRSEKAALTRPTNKQFVQLKHTTQRYADVFGVLNYPINLDGGALLSKPDPVVISDNIGGEQDKATYTIGVAPFAAHLGKQYPLPLLMQVMSKVSENINCRFIFFGGGKSESEYLSALVKEFANSESVATVQFEHQLMVIAHLDLMIAMDSGNAHLAAMYGIPALTIWGLTHPFAGFSPFGQPLSHCITVNRELFPKIPTSVYGHTCPKGYERAIDSIEPDEVVRKALEILRS